MNSFEKLPSLESEMNGLLRVCRESIESHIKALGCPVQSLSYERQQDTVSTLNKYIDFELGQRCLVGREIRIGGTGLVLISLSDGELLGAEVVSDGDVVEGTIETVCSLPVPTMACVLEGTEDGISSREQSLDALVVLQNFTYKTGLNNDGVFEAEHSLGDNYKAGLPMLYHNLVTIP